MKRNFVDVVHHVVGHTRPASLLDVDILKGQGYPLDRAQYKVLVCTSWSSKVSTPKKMPAERLTITDVQGGRRVVKGLAISREEIGAPLYTCGREPVPQKVYSLSCAAGSSMSSDNTVSLQTLQVKVSLLVSQIRLSVVRAISGASV